MVRNGIRGGVLAAAFLCGLPAVAQTGSEHAPGDRFRDCDECPEMMVVPAGSFTMGSPLSEVERYEREGPAHLVTIAHAFAVGVYEVTRDEYSRFVSAAGHATGERSCRVYADPGWEERSGHDWQDPGFRQTSRDPALCVSWDDAQAYVAWLSARTGHDYRLLSAAEWEYAARGGTSSRWYWESESEQCGYANGADESTHFGWRTGCDDGQPRSAPAGSYGANAFGLHDTLGNAWEWVRDCWNWSYAGAPVDGSAWEEGDCSSRVIRGASWANTPKYLRAAHRGGVHAAFRSDYVGFRVARAL